MNIEFMQKAIDIAGLSGQDMPVGAVIVKDGNIVAFAHNEKEKNNDVTAHAEIVALKSAAKYLSNWRLDDCDIYVTLEPCPMCLWAIMQSRIRNLYFGSYDTIMGGVSTLPNMIKIANSKLNIKGGIMESECNELINQYFKTLREKNNVKN